MNILRREALPEATLPLLLRYLCVLCTTQPVRVRSLSFVRADRSFLREQSHFHLLVRCPLAFSN